MCDDLFPIPPALWEQCSQCLKPAPGYGSYMFEASFCGQQCYDKMMKHYTDAATPPPGVDPDESEGDGDGIFD